MQKTKVLIKSKNFDQKYQKYFATGFLFLRSRVMQEILQLLSFTFFINLEICEYYQAISDNIFV